MPRDTRIRGSVTAIQALPAAFVARGWVFRDQADLAAAAGYPGVCPAVWRSIQACTSRSFRRGVCRSCTPVIPIPAICRGRCARGRPVSRRPRVPAACGASRREYLCGAWRAAGRRDAACRASALRVAPQPRGLRCAQVSPRRHGEHGIPRSCPPDRVAIFRCRGTLLVSADIKAVDTRDPARPFPGPRRRVLSLSCAHCSGMGTTARDWPFLMTGTYPMSRALDV